MEVIGLDHIYVSVSDFARSEAFYDRVMGALGFRKGDKPIGGHRHVHYFDDDSRPRHPAVHDRQRGGEADSPGVLPPR